MSSKTNAERGSAAENLLKNSIKNQPKCLDAIKKYFSFNKNSGFVKAYQTGKDGGKADIIIAMSSKEKISVNIKSYKDSSAGFNQAFRMHPNNFRELYT